MQAIDWMLVGNFFSSIIIAVAFGCNTQVYLETKRKVRFSFEWFFNPIIYATIAFFILAFVCLVSVILATEGVSVLRNFFGGWSKSHVGINAIWCILTTFVPAILILIDVSKTKKSINEILSGKEKGKLRVFKRTSKNFIKNLVVPNRVQISEEFLDERKSDVFANYDFDCSYYVEIYDRIGTYIATLVVEKMS